MDPAAQAIEENRHLRRTMRDMVALSALPAVWTGHNLEGIAASLADVLFHTLSLDLIFIRLADTAGGSALEVLRTSQSLDAAQKEALNEKIASIVMDNSGEHVATIADPFGEGMLRIAMTPLGVSDDHGVLLAGSRNEDFPKEQDRLLLGIGANQAAIVIQRRQAELALQQREQELQLVTDHAPVFLAHCDSQGRFKFVNKGYAARFGLTPQDVIGKHLRDVVGEGAYETLRPYVDAVLAGQPVEFEVEVPYSQIGVHTMHCTYAPELDKVGRVTGLVAVIVDVTERKRAEAALERSEQRFAEFMHHLPGLAWIKDADGRYVYANAAAERAFRVPREALYGRTDEDVFPPNTAAQFRHNDLLAMSSRSGVQLVEALANADGEVRYSLVSKFPLRDSGPSKLVGGMAIDITEQRRAEEEIRHREERFRSLMEQAPYSIQLFSPDGRTIRVNRAWEELWGVRFDQIADYNVLEDPQLKAKGILPYIQRAFAGESIEVPAIEYDPNVTIPDRTRYDDARRWVSAVAYPLKDDAGAVREVVLIHQDITGRRRAEEERERFAFLVENSRDFIGMCDTDFNPFYVNREGLHLVGLTSVEEALRTPVLEFFFPEDRAFLIEKFFPQVIRDGFGEVEIRFRHFQSGQPIWFAYSVLAMRDDSGQPCGFATISREINTLKKANEALQQADRRKDEFLATLAHELRNPLAPIRNALQILKMPRVDPHIVLQTREMIGRQVHHLVRLVDDLLDVSRVMRGKVELRKEPVELASIIVRAVEIAQPLIEVQRHQLELVVTPESLPLDADAVRLAQVVGNLLTNAAKYTESEGFIKLAAQREGDWAVLRIKDNGIGIAPDVLPHVFDLFMQVDYAATRSQGGLGIGLTLVKNLVEMHGGIVEAHSEGLGRGCEFVVRLPLLRRALRSATESSIAEQLHEAVRASGHRLLVVDDNQDAALSLATLLRLQGHDVQVAHDGESALSLATSYRPDVVFLDLGMPGMNGYEVARRLRQEPGLQHVVLAALTGWGQKEDRRRSAEAGFDHHLVKPPEPNTVDGILAALTRRRTSER